MTVANIDCAEMTRLHRLANLAGTVDKLAYVAHHMERADESIDDQLRFLDEIAAWLESRLDRNTADFDRSATVAAWEVAT